MPGEARPLRAELRVGSEALGVLSAALPATRTWERADQDLLELFASEVAVAIRNAQLFGQVEAQNSQLLELDAAKDDFLRGVSHNLQTPLTSIRAYAEQLDRRPARTAPGIISEQSERLSRMVRQLLTVTRLESGALHPRGEVVVARPPGPQGVGGAGRRGRAVHASTTTRMAGWRSPTPTSSTRSSGRSSTTPSSTASARRSRSRSSPSTERRPAAHDRVGPRAGRRRGETAAGCSAGSCAAPSGPPTRAAASGCTSSRELCRAMDGDLVLEPHRAGTAPRSASTCRREPPEEA